jgi:putative integral membrane protein (TIGR02587 family)
MRSESTQVVGEREGAKRGRVRKDLIGLGRAFAGALIFSLPLLMTMEMWWIGFIIDHWRLIILAIILIPLLVGLSHFSGFEETEGLLDDVADAFVAIAVGATVAAVILFVFGVITFGMPAQEVIGKIAMQAFPGSIGAMLAQDLLKGDPNKNDGDKQQRKQHPGYLGELFLMGVGAIFLGLTVAPTEEMVLLSYMMGPWREITLVLLSLAAMHAFVYALEFPGSAEPEPDAPFWSLFLRFTVVGYAIVLLISLYLLWTFGRTDGAAAAEIIRAAIVLGFPCAIGAAAARLIL